MSHFLATPCGPIQVANRPRRLVAANAQVADYLSGEITVSGRGKGAFSSIAAGKLAPSEAPLGDLAKEAR